MTAISSRGPPAPRRMTEPLPNCRSICEIANSRACRRSFLASAMRLSLFILARILARSLHVSFVIAFGHSRWPCSGASMSRDSDRGPKRHLRQLGVTGPAGPKLAPHQGGAWNQHPAEFTHRREAESLRERGIASGSAHPAERDVGRKRPLPAGKAELGERRVDAAGELDHLGRAVGHAGPDHPWPRARWEGAQPADLRLEGAQVQARLGQRSDDGVDPRLGHRAEKLEREVKIARCDPRDIARHRAKPLDRFTELSSDRVVEQDRDEGANVCYRGASRSWSRFRMPWRRSASGSATSAARRSARAPSWSPLSSFSRPRAASARESSGTGAGAGGVGIDATSGRGAGAGAVDGALSDGGASAGGAAAVGGCVRDASADGGVVGAARDGG